jgi:hypothetical protein
MSKQIYKKDVYFIKNLAPIAGMGIIAISILMTGCWSLMDAYAETGKAVSREAITKRIEPVGKVNIAHSPEKANETTATPATSQESSEEDGSQTPAHDDETGSQRTNAEKAPPIVNNDQE